VLHRKLGLTIKVAGPDGESVAPVAADSIRHRVAREEEAERGRLLYVAMTRARDYLALCGQSQPGSWFETMDETFGLSASGPGSLISGSGWTATVHRSTPAPVFAVKRSSSSILPVWETLMARATPLPPTVAVRNTFSISALLDYMADGLDPEEERDSGNRGGVLQSTARIVAAARGSLVHRLFELWDFVKGEPPDLDSLLRESGMPLHACDPLREGLSVIAERFKKASLHARLASQMHLEREAPFLLRLDDALISGTIDAVLDDGTLVDYKTGRHDPDRHARYEWQLLLYATAVQSLTGRTPTEGLLYYVDEDLVHPVALESAQVAWAIRHAGEAIAALRARP
jgi:ATP-dependent helicase/nuclease subunit A